MRARARLLPVVLGLVVLPAGAHEIDLGFNGDAFRAVYAAQLREELRLDVGWLHDGDAGDVAHASLLVTGKASAGANPLDAGIGGRLAAFDGEGSDRDGYALAVGGTVSWVVPRYDRFSLGGELYYAPDVLTGGDGEEYIDASARVAYAITRQAAAYLGVRYVRAEFEDRPDNHFDTGMHVGLNLRF